MLKSAISHFVRLYCILLLSTSFACMAQTTTNNWQANKFSMFIHYGLYSQAGGVWMGQPVKQGYSEQILSFGVHFSDWYEALARDFNATQWNADSIATLAKESGMRSIIFTSKHHDGFCMFNTQTTPYNIVKATPTRRDVMHELATACRKQGLNFGVYFSLIDWHFPPAMPISSHNADSIPPAHHQYNIKQVREILTNYGPISELWFDMGSLTPHQSQELYLLVHQLQPNCKISGRLGNGYHDFSVMADNQLPHMPMANPWQTAASIYPETWGYRSWQKHIPLKEKINEKITDLVKVVARGGNYLLNIGPKGDGAVVPYEKEVLLGIGDWLKTYGRTIYHSSATPYPYAMDWGECTQVQDTLYFFIYPHLGGKKISLPSLSKPLQKLSTFNNRPIIYSEDHTQKKLSFTVPSASNGEPWIVLKGTFSSGPLYFQPLPIKGNTRLTAANATPSFAYTCGDYYTGHYIMVKQNWYATQRLQKIYFTQEDLGKKINLKISSQQGQDILLSGKYPKETTRIDFTELKFGKPYIRIGGGVLGNIPETYLSKNQFDAKEGWITTDSIAGVIPEGPLAALYYIQDINSPRDILLPMLFGFDNGLTILINGQQITSVYNRNLSKSSKMVLIPLKTGKNRLAVKFYNRFGAAIHWQAKPLTQFDTYEIKLPNNGAMISQEPIKIELSRRDQAIFPTQDIDISNIWLE